MHKSLLNVKIVSSLTAKKPKIMQEEIIFSGFGGQGIMLAGKLLALAALKENWQTSWVPSYGAEVRGGTAHCMVKISDQEIASPFIGNLDTCIAFNQLAVDKFAPSLKKQGLLIINSSLAKKKPIRKDIKIIAAPLTDIAAKLGNIKVANTVALGIYIAKKKNIKPESMFSAMKEMAPKGRQDILEINIRALKEGMKIVS